MAALRDARKKQKEKAHEAQLESALDEEARWSARWRSGELETTQDYRNLKAHVYWPPRGRPWEIGALGVERRASE